MTISHRIGFVSMRFAGTDGVSLETAKWASVLAALGHECFYFAGASDRPAARSYVVAEAHFAHPEVLALTEQLFGAEVRAPATSAGVARLTAHLKSHLQRFRERFDVDLLVVENALSLPMHVPLALALTEMIAETGLATIAHHHDFAWERQRFARSAAGDYLRAAFPPALPSIRHVVINSVAAQQLALRVGVGATLIPNVMDFAHPPAPPDGYADDLRAALEIDPDAALILQPTRIVPRKRIEHAIELVGRWDDPAVLVISHQAGDEGMAYADYLREHARRWGVRVIFGADRIAHHRARTPSGEKIYGLADVYHQADLVTYPSAIEGFGNALLEAVYYRRPVVVNRYEIFQADIEPRGFEVIGFEDYVDQATVAAVQALLRDPARIAAMAAHNYEIGRRAFSYEVLTRRLDALLTAWATL